MIFFNNIKIYTIFLLFIVFNDSSLKIINGKNTRKNSTNKKINKKNKSSVVNNPDVKTDTNTNNDNSGWVRGGSRKK